MLAVILGIVFIVAGGFGVFVWKNDFFLVIRGLVPFMLVIGGFISVVAGVTNITESSQPKMNEENPAAENKGK